MMPASTCSNVVFPEPDGPMIATDSPSYTSIEASSKATVAPYCLDNLLARILGIVG